MRTGNPALNDKTVENFGVFHRDTAAEQAPSSVMTISGTAQKTMFLLLLASGTACFTWSRTFAAVEANPAAALPRAFGGAIVGLITGLVICFKHTWAPTSRRSTPSPRGYFSGACRRASSRSIPGS